MDKFFSGKVAIVTGGSSGIGRATAFAFADAGAKVVVADWQDDAGGKVAAQLREKGAEAIFVKCDVSKADQVKNMVDETLAKFGRLDFAFNNAGIEGTPVPVTADCTEEQWRRTLDINLTGVFLCMKNQIPAILKQGGGAIVNCASIAGVVGFQGMPAYVASKHGVVGLTKTAALDYARANLRINVVCPGVIHTPMIDRFTQGSAEAAEQLASGAPMARMGRPEEIADAVLFLCSEKSTFMTGQAMVVDGGWVVR